MNQGRVRVDTPCFSLELFTAPGMVAAYPMASPARARCGAGRGQPRTSKLWCGTRPASAIAVASAYADSPPLSGGLTVAMINEAARHKTPTIVKAIAKLPMSPNLPPRIGPKIPPTPYARNTQP